MKTIQLLLLFVFSLALTNCQKEEEEIIKDPPIAPQNIVVGSPLSKLISRTSQNPTQCDNVLDGNSCFSIQLPVTVTVNGNQVVVTSEAGYQTVQNIKDTTAGNDIVYFSYPITIKYKNYESQVISNYSEFHNVVLSCPSDDGLNEIDCISFNYPIVINVYNTNNQVANTITIQSNSQLYSFIYGLNASTIAAIAYPISLTDSSGNNVVVNSNTELESFIENSIDDCDDDVGVDDPTFTEVITSGNWYVSYFNEDGNIETYDFYGYSFAFLANGNVNATKNSVTTTGNWVTHLDDGYNKIEFSFTDDALGDLEEDWIILEYNSTVIRLKHVSGGNGGTDYLNFTKL